METRKIQNTASGSFFITLPKTMVTELDINKGDEIVISRDENGSIKLTPIKDSDKYLNEFFVETENYIEPNSLERCINSSYIQGADIIHLNAPTTISPENKSIVKRTVSNLIGTEISEIRATKITIRVLVDPLKFPLANLITMIYKLVEDMHRDAIRSFQEQDEILANDVINRESEVEKFYHLMLRQLNLSLIGRLALSDICDSELKIDCVLGILLARDLSKMAHYAMHLAEQALKLIDKNLDAGLIHHLTEMSRFVLKMQREAYLAFFKNDFQRANRIINRAFEVQEFDTETEREILERVDDSSSIISLISISRNLRNIASSAVAVSQDFLAKHRPHTISQIKQDKLPEPLDLIKTLGYEIED